MYILGVSALYHDSAAALICDGIIVAAAQEERFTRMKNDLGIPVHAIRYVMEEGRIGPKDLEAVVYYDSPLLTLDRLMKNMRQLGSDGAALLERSFPSMTASKLWIHKQLEKAVGGLGRYGKLLTVKHHYSHAASAFYPSPYKKAVILTIDGVGEWDTTTMGVGGGSEIELKKSISYPHSIGLLYSAFTYFCGFKVNSGEYKFMGLAPYGRPVYYEQMKKYLVEIKQDGSYALNMDYFAFYRGNVMTNHKFEELFGGPKREMESAITKREMDIAASAQKLTEEMMLGLVLHAKEEFGQGLDSLVMAGGSALNCVANGKILNSGIFKNIWIQPAAGDCGGALGCALYAYYAKFGGTRRILLPDGQQGSFLGPRYSNREIRKYLDGHGCPYDFLEGDAYYALIAKLLEEKKVIGLFQGRMEYGPRALGSRSIICDPRSPDMQSRLNLKIKSRESFRPFAPSVLEEQVSDYFELDRPSPYMLFVEQVKKERRLPFSLEERMKKSGENMIAAVKERRSDIPAVTHVDYSARIQTVRKEENPVYYRILKAFQEKTGCGVIVNTSFNVRGEPIVCTPEEAYACFMQTQMDVLVLENCILYKQMQPEWKGKGLERQYEPD